MRIISKELQEHFASMVTSLATCWQIRLRNGKVIGFTDHTENIFYENVNYIAESGIETSSIETKTSLSADNLEIISVVDDESITQNDLINGVYEGSEVIVFKINYRSLKDGKIILHRGWVSEISIKCNKFFAEIRGIGQKLISNVNQIYSKNCRANFGDSRCKINLEKYSFTGKIDEIMGQDFFYSEDLKGHENRFIYGKIEFLSGGNRKLITHIKDFHAGNIKLISNLPYQLEKNNKFIITYGCDKSFETCNNYYKNHLNFRGEPHIPDIS